MPASVFPTEPTEPTDAERRLAARVMGELLAAAYLHARVVGDPALCGYLLALLRRAGEPATPQAPAGTRSGAIWRQRRQAQLDGWAIAAARVDAWRVADEPATIDDLCREVYLVGVSAGIDSIVPEWADQFLRGFLDDLAPDEPSLA